MPAKIRRPVIDRVIFVCSESLTGFLKCRKTSTITLKPIPPRMINVVMQSVTVTSSTYPVMLLKLPNKSKPALLKADIEWKKPNHRPFCQPRSNDQRTAKIKAKAISIITVRMRTYLASLTMPATSVWFSDCCMISRCLRPMRRPRSMAKNVAIVINPRPPTWIKDKITT
ncbi:MAG: hypothetical protein BWY70_02004 [Bacteroidetes bacterium ADurb.Bin408]|nr:MAG: hypothetical protein BWY70_02004 [Bacteroidetes bacterium ADurb.Bin408]